jgi:hypothetical protein
MRRLHKILMILTAVSAFAPAMSLAQAEPTSTARVTGATTGNGRGFGIGATSFFGPPAGTPNGVVPNLLLTWGDHGGRFHLDGLFGFYNNGATDFDFGARGWYHVHAASSADFSVGAGVVLTRRRIREPSVKWDFLIDLGAQIRVFVVPNVALLGSAGMGIYMPDTGDTHVSITGSLVGSLGLAYYFL